MKHSFFRNPLLRSAVLAATATAMVLSPASAAYGQTSSLYIQPSSPPPSELTGPGGRIDRLSSSLAQASFSAVAMPEPRKFALHDLITIVIRESVENNSTSKIETKKDVKFDGEISDFPKLQLSDLIDARITQNVNGVAPKLGVNFKNDFNGEGSAKRTDSFTSRITGRIIDVKPNGTLVLEARKHMESDKEAVDIVLTGTCRKEDVAGDNTVLSTQLYDLHLRKETSGEIRKSAEKGFLTRILEGIFNF
ncbi:MAG: flagellar basal body L-ring protein FlgH [Phycisphaeraceae bacterium]|nr:flagellar basal body L-ring protein FlgH [Phycisphaeraceae bacterium]